MKSKFLLLALLAATLVKAAPPLEEGKTIFTSRCAGCHNVHKILVGPALAGVDQRHTLDWIVKFVHSSQAVIKKGDPAAVALFNQYNHIQMPDHPDLTADNIKNVVEYIKTEAAAAAAPKADAGKKEAQSTQPKPLTPINYGYLLTYIALGVLLILTILFAYKVNQYKKQVEASKK